MTTELFEGCLRINPAQQTLEALLEPEPVPAKKGVLLFADKDDRPIQLLIAANIRRTAAAKLFPQDPAAVKKHANIASITRKIYYLCCYNDFKCLLKHYQIAKALYPDSYTKIITFPRQSYVKITPGAKWPFFSLTDKPSISKTENFFGPFPTRRSAGQFIGILQNVFGLCQRPGLLESGKDTSSCTYLQMNTCPAPCIGKTSRSEYLNWVEDAVAAAKGNLRRQKEKMLGQMKKLAEQREFEQADIVKKSIRQLENLTKETYRWTTEISELAVLHIDRSAKIKIQGKRKKEQTFSAFVIRSGHIFELADFTLETIDAFYKSFMQCLTESVFGLSGEQLSEQLSFLGFSLYRSKPAGVWFDCSSTQQFPTPKEIKIAICKRFEGNTRNCQYGIKNNGAIDNKANT